MIFPRTPSFNLVGKRALVTGATSGIGEGCAVALADAGAHVTLVARTATKLKTQVTAFTSRGWKATALPLDISDIAATQATLADTEPFDILVNAAGLARHTPATKTTEADFDAASDLNFKAAFFITRAVAQGLIDCGKSGSLINISSQMGHVGGIDRAVYSATKHALEGMTKSMAIEWGPHQIRVNTICPTFIRTPLTTQTFAIPERRAWIEDKIKLGRVGEVSDIMGAVVFFASDAAALITGTSLLIDGGWTAD